MFFNGSTNKAQQAASAGNAAEGIAATKGGELPDTPKWTDAVGGLYAHGPWHASLTYKQVGDAISNDAVPIRIPSYYTVNADGAYSFSRFQVKVQVFNLFDKRQIVTETGGFYTYQSGREIQLTLVGKFR